MANPTGTTYLQANAGYTWMEGDIYEIPQTDQLEGAATGASFSGLGVVNQPHQVLLNKAEYLYNRLNSIPHGMHVYNSGSGNFVVPAYVTSLYVRAWGAGGAGGNSTGGYFTSGGGGGGGAYFETVISTTPAASIAWAITSTHSSFGGWSAGAGAAGQTAAAAFGVGGTGGTASGSGSGVQLTGAGGETGRAALTINSSTYIIGGEGGASFGCGHSHFAWVGSTAGSFSGTAGIFPGQGGGGGGLGGAGGAGGPGLIIVLW